MLLTIIPQRENLSIPVCAAPVVKQYRGHSSDNHSWLRREISGETDELRDF